MWQRKIKTVLFCLLGIVFATPYALFAASSEAWRTGTAAGAPPRMYILEERTPVPCDDYQQFAEALFTRDRHVVLSEFEGYTISTVFTGYDPHPSFRGKPHVFETAVYRNDTGEYTLVLRSATWAEARETHFRTINLLAAGLAGAK